MITPIQTEKSVQKILNDFLKSYFDGGEHLDPPVRFPECAVLFNSALPDWSKPVIHVVFADTQNRQFWNRSATSMEVRENRLFHLFVRVKNAGEAMQTNDFKAREIADLLKYILQIGPQEITQPGLTHPQILHGPSPQNMAGMQVRMLTLAATVRYEVPVA